MSISDNFSHQHLRIEYTIIIRNHAPRYSQDRTENAKVEENCSVRRNFQMNEDVGIQKSGEEQHSGKGAGNEGDKSAGSLALIRLCRLLEHTAL